MKLSIKVNIWVFILSIFWQNYRSRYKLEYFADVASAWSLDDRNLSATARWKDNESNRRSSSEAWMKSIDEERDSSFKLNQGQKAIWKGKGRSKL